MNANLVSRKIRPTVNPAQRMRVPTAAVTVAALLSLLLNRESALGQARHTAQDGTTRQGSGSLSGSVYDASKAAVPGAVIVVSNPELRIKEITTSNAAGEYSFRSLEPGSYLVEVRHPGFRLYRTPGTVVAADGKATLDVTLEVGEISETVEVVGHSPIDSASAARTEFFRPDLPLKSPVAAAERRLPRRIRVGGNVQPTRLIHQIKPVFPEQLQQAGIEGTVLLESVILRDGSLGEVRAVNKLVHPELVQAALDAVKEWRYEPTLLNGEPVEVLTNITVHFRVSPAKTRQ
jgi:TonB family protein